MKDFNKFIKEDYGSSETPNNLGGSIEVNPSELSNPAVLRRINAIVGQIGNYEFILPEHGIHKLRGSLNKIGLSFGQTPTIEGKSGSFDMPLALFGGRFGKDENTPYDEFINDDGISNKVEGGLSLKIEYEMMPKNQSCRVYASIS
tara:strand:- start:35 stop:472 length:438 start_codon:yes stop_codon:yes gene_type:complete